MGNVKRKPVQNLVKTAQRDPDVARTVTVACKLPNDLILSTFHWEDEKEAMPLGQSRTVKVSKRDPIQYEVRGNAVPWNVRPDFDMRGGYALTPNIPKEFWERWLELYKDSDMVGNKFIFAYERPADVKACANEHADLWTGLEPLAQQELDDRGRITNRDPRLKALASISTFNAKQA